jgi:hypothetical protein
MPQTHANRRSANGVCLRASLCPDAAGTPASLTVSVRLGTPAHSRAVGGDAATAVFDSAGRLLSIEVRGRVRLDLLAALARHEGPAARRFLGQVVPPALVRFS